MKGKIPTTWIIIFSCLGLGLVWSTFSLWGPDRSSTKTPRDDIQIEVSKKEKTALYEGAAKTEILKGSFTDRYIEDQKPRDVEPDIKKEAITLERVPKIFPMQQQTTYIYFVTPGGEHKQLVVESGAMIVPGIGGIVTVFFEFDRYAINAEASRVHANDSDLNNCLEVNESGRLVMKGGNTFEKLEIVYRAAK